MKFKKYITICLVIVLSLMLYSCGSSRRLSKEGTDDVSSAAVDYGKKIMKNAQTAKTITSKVKVQVMADGKNFTVNGTLRMKRDDVIQLSLSMLGFEIGKMEFLTNEVLIIDRFHKQYVRVPYNQVDFLNKTNIDFYALQAIFWNELFVPGVKDMTAQLGKFTMASSGDHTLLSLKTEPRLEYDFLANTATAVLVRTTITPKDLSQEGEFVCKYSDYTKFGGKSFPTGIDLNFSGEGVKAELILTLSDLNNKEGWATRTEISSKYKQVSAKGILGKLMSH